MDSNSGALIATAVAGAFGRARGSDHLGAWDTTAATDMTRSAGFNGCKSPNICKT